MSLSRSLICLALLAASGSAGAIEPIPETTGWSGFVAIGGGVADFKSNMVAGIDAYGIDLGKPTISSLSDEPDSRSIGIPQVNLNINYTFRTRTQLFFGNSLENVVQFDTASVLGIRQQFADKSIVELSAVSTPALAPGQVWADPYVVDEKRVTTDRTSRGLRIEYDKILGTGLGVRYTKRSTEIDKERSGTWLELTEDEMALLDREGDSNRFQISYRFPAVGRNVFDVRVGRLQDDLDGKAMSGDQDELFLTHAYMGDRFVLVSNLFAAKQDFDAVNPVFGKTRKDDNWGLAFVLIDKKIFRSPHWFGQLTVAWYEQDSNIDFYDASSTLVMVAGQYRF